MIANSGVPVNDAADSALWHKGLSNAAVVMVKPTPTSAPSAHATRRSTSAGTNQPALLDDDEPSDAAMQNAIDIPMQTVNTWKKLMNKLEITNFHRESPHFALISPVLLTTSA